MNRTQVQNWFGDRGMYISANNIKVRGRWLLVQEWWSIEDNEVDCYDLAAGSICAEPWSAIKYTDSPFIPRNEEATQRAIAKMDNEYGKYLTEIHQDEGGEFCPEEMEDMTNVTKHTRATASGRMIICPVCKRGVRVYHFSWSALMCLSCEQPMNKEQWLVLKIDKERQIK